MGKTTESLSKRQNNNLIQIGKIGRTIGFDGSLRLFVQTDFPHSIAKDKTYHTSHIAYPSVIIESYEHLPNKEYAKVRFCGISTSEEARALTNHTLYTTIAQSRADCVLKEGEFFWFDIIGLEIIDNGVLLGIVDDIERIGCIDYLVIKTNINQFSKPKSFMIPYIDRYIIDVDLTKKVIYTADALGILETS